MLNMVKRVVEFSDTHLPYSQGVSGRAALGVAAFAGHLEVVRALIAASADVNQKLIRASAC